MIEKLEISRLMAYSQIIIGDVEVVKVSCSCHRTGCVNPQCEINVFFYCLVVQLCALTNRCFLLG